MVGTNVKIETRVHVSIKILVSSMAASAPMATNLLLAFYHYHYHIYGEAEPAMHIVLQEYNALSAPEAHGSPSHFWLHLLFICTL